MNSMFLHLSSSINIKYYEMKLPAKNLHLYSRFYKADWLSRTS